MHLLATFLLALVASATQAFRSVSLVWDTDSSASITTPPGIIRGTDNSSKAPVANNGHAVNIYGNKGIWPRINATDNSTVNGGVPQLGNLTLHTAKLVADLAVLIPDPHFAGICLLDYEQWRADWNTTGHLYRALSLNLTGGNEAVAKTQYEAAAKSWFLGTIAAVKTFRPGCRCGWYAYPSNALPHLVTPSWVAYCDAHPSDCWFDRGGQGGQGDGYLGPGGDAMRAINDELSWLFSALDVVSPAVYLGIPTGKATTANSTAYVRSVVQEAVRVATPAGKPVVAVVWHHYDSYWLVPPPAPRPFLSAADLAVELGVPLAAGADGLLIWGAVRPGNDNTTEGAAALQVYANTVLANATATLCPHTAASGLQPLAVSSSGYHCCDPANGESCFF